MVEKFWFGNTRDFLKVAKESKEKYPWLSCFASKQSVEFTIKGILMKYKGSYPFTYDSSELLDTLNKELSVAVPEEIIKECDFLTPHYTLTRYSIVSSYNVRKTENCIGSAEKVLIWLSGAFDEVKEVIKE
ncbi:HEPN domain-containing protein [Sulfolobaceae archaeon RB850M]